MLWSFDSLWLFSQSTLLPWPFICKYLGHVWFAFLHSACAPVIHFFFTVSGFADPTPVLLPGKPHGWRSLVGCSPWGCEESETTERLHFHFSLSCTGEGNGNPLQCSCLENPRDGGAWWTAVYGVAQSRTRLKRLSSSSSSFSEKLKRKKHLVT